MSKAKCPKCERIFYDGQTVAVIGPDKLEGCNYCFVSLINIEEGEE